MRYFQPPADTRFYAGVDLHARYLDKLSSRMGKAKALSALAHKLGRAFYHMIHKKEVFNLDQFLRH